MSRRVLIAILLTAVVRGWADTDVPAIDNGDLRAENSSEQEWESKGVIPLGGLTVSTQPITPISILPDRIPYEQALVELVLAQDLWKKGNAEAASDIALEAYDDLMGTRMPRKSKKKRQKLREERRQAATVYTDSSLAYIQDYVKRNGHTARAVEEGRARLGDLRDVTQNYPDLNKKLNRAMEPYSVQTSSTTVAAASSSAPASTTTVKN